MWENWGCLGGEINVSAPKKEFNSEIWGKGVCDIWGKMGCPGGEIKDLPPPP